MNLRGQEGAPAQTLHAHRRWAGASSLFLQLPRALLLLHRRTAGFLSVVVMLGLDPRTRRWAMLGVLGALVPEALSLAGTDIAEPVWWKARPPPRRQARREQPRRQREDPSSCSSSALPPLDAS